MLSIDIFCVFLIQCLAPNNIFLTLSKSSFHSHHIIILYRPFCISVLALPILFDLRIEHGGSDILANMNYVYNIYIKSHLRDLSIDIFVFKMSKLRAV